MKIKKTTNYDANGKYVFDDKRIVAYGMTEKQIHDDKLARAAKKEQERFDRPFGWTRAAKGMKALAGKVRTAVNARAKSSKVK